jgi:predicted RNase H-like HicB family nuclease
MAQYQVVLEAQPEGGYTAHCVEIPGAISEGETMDEAIANVKDAILGILEVRRAKALQNQGPGVSFHQVDVEA